MKVNYETFEEQGRERFAVQKEILENEGYEEHGMPFAKLHGVFKILISIAVFAVFYFGTEDMHRYMKRSDLLPVLGWFIIMLIMVFFILSTHEKIHSIAFSVFSRSYNDVLYCEEYDKNPLKCKFGAVCTAPLGKFQYIVCCLAPVVVHGCIFAIPAFYMLSQREYVGRYLMMMVFMINIVGASSDLLDAVIVALSYRNRDVKILSYPDKIGCAFFVKPQPEIEIIGETDCLFDDDRNSGYDENIDAEYVVVESANVNEKGSVLE